MQIPLQPFERRRRAPRLLAQALVVTGVVGCAPALSDPGSPPRTTDAAMGPDSADDVDMATDGTGGRYDATGGESRPAMDATVGREASTGLSSADLVGQWTGTTSQGQPISFTIDAAGLDAWQVGWQLPACASTTTSTFPPAPVVDGQVMRSVQAGAGGISATLTISFSSSAMATGSLKFTVNPIPGVASCAGTATVTFAAIRAT